MYSNILYRIIQIITAWMLFAVLICGFLLYDLIDPALRNSLHANNLEGEEKEDNDDMPEELQSLSSKGNEKSNSKNHAEIGVVPV